MRWFKKKTPQSTEPVLVQPAVNSRVEVELHKEASKEAKHKVDEANKKLNELLVENGFTLKIYLAAGGSHPRKRRT